MRSLILLALLLTGLGWASANGQPPAWHEVAGPSPGGPASVGSYANGCLAGAEPLPPEGPGYQAIRLSRQRFYGHPELIAYLRELGARVAAAGLGIATVGDLAQPRGGPMSYGHVSHQTGLDADIWYRLDLPALPRPARETLEPVSMVDGPARRVDPGVWGARQAELVRLAASDPRVARIFVHPAIKRDLCRRDWADRAWLRTIRPWRGHDGHFHVRLGCPPDSPECRPQDPPPPGDGCGAELAAWLEPPPPAPGRPAPPVARPPKVLPASCHAILGAGAG